MPQPANNLTGALRLLEDCEDRSASVGIVLVRSVRLGAEGVGVAGSASLVWSVGLVEGVTLVLLCCDTGTASALDELLSEAADF